MVLDIANLKVIGYLGIRDAVNRDADKTRLADQLQHG
jgi:hypothetical protein